MEKTIENIKYRTGGGNSLKELNKSIEVIGLDTEADTSGRCFLIATSRGDVFRPEDFFRSLFSREYQGKKFVVYNLKYDEGAILQSLPIECLHQLREDGKTTFEKYKISIIPRKVLSISKGGYTCHIYDMWNFYQGSLQYNSVKYLGRSKKEIQTKSFDNDYIRRNWLHIGLYCIVDAVLVKELADLIIRRFESYGLFVQKLYSTAYVSFQYFRRKTKYVTVNRFWKEDKKLLDFSMQSFNGGKFEVTSKRKGYLFEYDINSAYPYEIANLIDIKNARVEWSKKYSKNAVYGFIKVQGQIPYTICSPVALKRHNVNVYPVGWIDRVITKNEYDYLVKYGADLKIIDAVWLFIDKKEYPYKKEIYRLTELKKQFKIENKELDYHTVKIIMNSFYGKFVQLINKKEYWQAGISWNPIFGSIITSNVRIKVSEYQQLNKSIIAVHTDSLISTKPLDISKNIELGEMSYECEGEGIIIGCGIYQIGEKSRFRGFQMKEPLINLIDKAGRYLEVDQIRAYTWREVIFHGWEKGMINRFDPTVKKVEVDFDQKRIWLNDYKKWRDVLHRNVDSVPHYITPEGI